MTAEISLTKREYSLLLMDIVEVPTTPESEPIAAELRRGCSVHVTPALLRELVEFADRDADPSEQAAYRRLLRKARAAQKGESSAIVGDHPVRA